MLLSLIQRRVVGASCSLLVCVFASRAADAGLIVAKTGHIAQSTVRPAHLSNPITDIPPADENRSVSSAAFFGAPTEPAEARTAARSLTEFVLAANAVYRLRSSSTLFNFVGSEATLEVFLHNTGLEPVEVILDFTLPPGEMELTANLEAPFNQVAQISAAITTTASTKTGPIDVEHFNFDALLRGRLSTAPNAVGVRGFVLETSAASSNPNLDLSPLLTGIVQPLNDRFNFVQSFLNEYDDFSGSVSLGVLPADTVSSFRYVMRA